MYLLYDLILLASALVVLPYYLLRTYRHGEPRRVRERLGYYRPAQLQALRGRRVFWLHAVSVGETRAAIPLIRALKEQYPDTALILSNLTATGHAIGRQIPEVDLCLFFPFDLSFVVRRALQQTRPALILVVETEIWPNFLRLARRLNIPILLVNGRISDRSYPRYLQARPLLRPVLRHFSDFCMQTPLDAEKIRRLGAPPGRVSVTGNLKFDMRAVAPEP